ncbi:hypothetical protein L202_04621 [Cryptococcus amylolentus CBS 6039]|uniref:DUF803-domain-containing protein n=1 Tax=Cryptococcus amylolentus CBS 6039 TaxID=1295533 RepID=A0A1E3HM64_9TREE|nr:hypothetical protein L202_04621 [Cryptococcus amylolentus CBS 6039]ODN77443.1 hypothetical protein L202_04621 [Cryptococcus amylolentus CBS 6039]
MSSSISASSTASSTASATSSSSSIVGNTNSSSFKIVGICLAVGSGLLIGTSFVIKKKGLINSTKKYGNQAGEGHAYLKSWMWWLGMITMIVGEICNFVAYAFTEAILVTPMGALSVVVAAILSHFLLKEKLTFFGWIGCTLCIMGAVILALNAPEEQSVTTIAAFKKLFLSAGFLAWAGILIVGSLVMVFYVAPRWGKKSMLPYISICSLIGGLSVSCTQGLGSSIVTSIQGDNQVKNWFFWFLFVFVVITLLTEINYLNKALELFNTSMVVPVYFCFFSSATLITSFILYQGLKASAVTLITMVLGFLVTCLGITLLQLSKVDPEALESKLDRRSTMLMEASRHQTGDVEKGDVVGMEDPGMDALRGGFGAVGSIIRARSVSRRLSSGSTLSNGGKYGAGGLSTHGMGHMPRYQLSDNPMPSDAMSQISMHSAKSPSSRSFMSGHAHFLSPNRTGNSRDDGDIVNMYQYDREDSHNLHAPPPPLRSYSTENHHHTYHPNPLYPPVLEEDEQGYEKEVDAKGRYGSSRTKIYVDDAPDQVQSAPVKGSGGYKNPYDVYPARANEPKPHKSIGNIFHFPSGPDLSLDIPNHQRSRQDSSRSSRREKDHQYPTLSKKDRNDAQEKEERRGLVRSDSDGSAEMINSSPEGEGGEGEVSDDDSVSRQSEPPSAISTRATIGMGTRVNLSQADLRSERSGGSGGEPVRKGTKSSRSQAQIQQQQGSKAPRRLPDVPGFAAGPPYGS